ncbi:MAG: sensor histidine kinase [Acidimicrobiales bacterium]
MAVATVLTLVAIALVTLVERELFNNLDNSLEQRADAYETSFGEKDDDDLNVLLNTNDEDRAAQLVDTTGVVIAATPNLSGSQELEGFDIVDGQLIRSARVDDLEDDNFRILSRSVETDSGRAVLHLAQNVDDLDDTIRNLIIALAAIVPIVVALLAALVWWLVGRTLRPVEMIRAEAADISGTDLERRLPVPDQADEIARLAQTMNQMLDRIDHAGRKQRQFVADASHELRTPLTRIRTELEVDRSQPGNANLAATHDSVLEEAIAVQGLLENLLFLARSDEQKPDSTPLEPVDLDDIVLREAISHRITSGVTIDTSAVSAAHLEGDANQLTRLVQNLLSNAVHHADSRIAVALTEGDDRLELSITDDGPGVPATAIDRIFERFGRADDARTRDEGGTGLGLAIVRDIARRHGGDVHYDSGWTDGARFIIELPKD